MRRAIPLTVILAALTLVGGGVAAAAGAVEVDVDQAARITVAGQVRDILVGNPAIADVTVMDAHHVVLTGKAFGATNLMIIGQNGRPMFNRMVVVGAPSADHVSLYRGPAVTEYACAPRCERQIAGSQAAASAASTN